MVVIFSLVSAGRPLVGSRVVDSVISVLLSVDGDKLTTVVHHILRTEAVTFWPASGWGGGLVTSLVVGASVLAGRQIGLDQPPPNEPSVVVSSTWPRSGFASTSSSLLRTICFGLNKGASVSGVDVVVASVVVDASVVVSSLVVVVIFSFFSSPLFDLVTFQWAVLNGDPQNSPFFLVVGRQVAGGPGRRVVVTGSGVVRGRQLAGRGVGRAQVLPLLVGRQVASEERVVDS